MRSTLSTGSKLPVAPFRTDFLRRLWSIDRYPDMILMAGLAMRIRCGLARVRVERPCK